MGGGGTPPVGDATRRARDKVRALRETLEADGDLPVAPVGSSRDRPTSSLARVMPENLRKPEETWQSVPAPAPVRDVSVAFYLMGLLLVLASGGISFGGVHYSYTEGGETFNANIGVLPLWASLLLLSVTLPMAVGALLLLRRGHNTGIVLASLLAAGLVFRGVNMFMGVPMLSGASGFDDFEAMDRLVRQMAIITGVLMLANATGIVVVLATPLRDRLRRGVVRKAVSSGIS